MAMLSMQQGVCISLHISCREPSSCAGNYVAILFVFPCHGHCGGDGWNGRDVVLLLNSSTLMERSSLSPLTHKHFRGVEAFDSSQHQIFLLISCCSSSPAVPGVPSARGWHLGPCSLLLLQSALHWSQERTLSKESGSSGEAGVSHHCLARGPQLSSVVHARALLHAWLRCSKNPFQRVVFKYCSEFKRRQMVVCPLVSWEQTILIGAIS